VLFYRFHAECGNDYKTNLRNDVVCGICGELRFDGIKPDPKILNNMGACLVRRGPDNYGSYYNGPIALGHRRLAIIDLTTAANQPMLDQELGLVLIFNGTIYNHLSLRQDLQALGYRFSSHSDTEIINKAYQEWGPNCVEKLDGMFAFAIWDLAKQTLFLARDRFGIKPLYWSENKQRLRFASNTQALLASGDIDTDLDPIALHHQFTLHGVVPAPHTILKGIRKLPPAHWLLIHNDGTKHQQRYWKLIATRPAEPKTDEDWQQLIAETLQETVKTHYAIADVPVGVLLSGGLDSSLLVGILSQAGINPIYTFSVGFEDQPEEAGHEFAFSDLIATTFATKHHKIQISNTEVLQRLPEAIDAMAEPMFGQDALAFYLLAEQVSKQIKVVQSGQGADEVFAGYFWYPRMAAESGNSWLERLQNHYFDRDHAEYQRMVTPNYQLTDPTAPLIANLLAEPDADEFLDALLRLDVTTLIVDDPVKRVDNMTMAHGLEARVPFLDHKLVELVAQCPPELKLRDGGKHLLKTMARGLIPDAVIDRPKGYFPLPALKYVRGKFLDFMRDILQSPTAKSRGLYEPVYLNKLLAEPDQHYTRIQGNKLWHCAVLEYWLQRHLVR